MKRQFIALLTILIGLVFAGCSAAQDSDVPAMIDPENHTPLLPEFAPSTQLPPEGSAKAIAASEALATASDTKYTKDMAWALNGGRFVSEEFTFSVTPLWRDHFGLSTEDSSISVLFNSRTFLFQYVEQETGVALPVLRIDVIPAQENETYSITNNSPVGVSADGGYYYYIVPVSPEIPPEFTHSTDFIEVLASAVSAESLSFTVVA